MNIVFLCSSLEPGRDGVGDYTRRLAQECAARGHVCRMVALHDPHVTAEIQTREGDVRLMRLPAAQDWTCSPFSSSPRDDGLGRGYR